jgi:hypothetical protein
MFYFVCLGGGIRTEARLFLPAQDGRAWRTAEMAIETEILIASSAIIFTTNPTWISYGLNPVRRSQLIA